VLDTEWAGAVAPEATLLYMSCSSSNSTNTAGIFLSAEAVIEKTGNHHELSYGNTEVGDSMDNTFLSNLWEQRPRRARRWWSRRAMQVRATRRTRTSRLPPMAGGECVCVDALQRGGGGRTSRTTSMSWRTTAPSTADITGGQMATATRLRWAISRRRPERHLRQLDPELLRRGQYGPDGAVQRRDESNELSADRGGGGV